MTQDFTSVSFISASSTIEGFTELCPRPISAMSGFIGMKNLQKCLSPSEDDVSGTEVAAVENGAPRAMRIVSLSSPHWSGIVHAGDFKKGCPTACRNQRLQMLRDV